ncbi:MAG TPA: hypothetical protein VHT68_26605 [Pseudolabrys sp.]|nr:hypothetical protein [Pseudolabrys sp.]
MTSLKQIEANRLNALKSTGPRTEEGKLRSRGNAVRHGLTAETVITGFEDREDYEAFEASVIADYDARSAVERELVLRLASLLWRLRRATGIETALFEFVIRQDSRSMQKASSKQANVSRLFAHPNCAQGSKIAEFFLRLNDLPTCPIDRLSRYEIRLWRQARQIVIILRKPRKSESQRRNLGFTIRRDGRIF